MVVAVTGVDDQTTPETGLQNISSKQNLIKKIRITKKCWCECGY